MKMVTYELHKYIVGRLFLLNYFYTTVMMGTGGKTIRGMSLVSARHVIFLLSRLLSSMCQHILRLTLSTHTQTLSEWNNGSFSDELQPSEHLKLNTTHGARLE